MFDENHLKSDLDEGGRVMDSYGYVMIKKHSHPYAQSSGYIREHRLVMEVELQRYLTADEIIHHKNRDKSDNRPENLEVVDMAEHRRIHNIEDRIYESKYDLELIRELYLEGYSTRKIAEMIGIGKSTVGYYVRKWGISRTELSGDVHRYAHLVKNEREITDEEIEVINLMRSQGCKIKEIEDRIGYSKSTIYKYLSKDFVKETDRYPEISAEDVPDILKYYHEDGLSQKKISEKYGTYRKMIGNILAGKTRHFKNDNHLESLLESYK